MSYALNDQVVLVTLPDAAPAEALTAALTRNGATVVTASMPGTRPRGEAVDPGTESEATHAVDCNLLDEGEVRRMIHRIVHRFGRLDAVINVSSGGVAKVPVVECPTRLWDHTFHANVRTTFWVCREAIPAMRRNGRGSIVNVAAPLPSRATAHRGPAVAANGALESFSRALAEELADSGVRVNVVDPGPSGSRPRSAARQDPSQEQLGLLLAYLASPTCDEATGTCIKATAFKPPAGNA